MLRFNMAKPKPNAASAAGTLLQRKGVKSRKKYWASLTPEQRAEHGRRAALARWGSKAGRRAAPKRRKAD